METDGKEQKVSKGVQPGLNNGWNKSFPWLALNSTKLTGGQSTSSTSWFSYKGYIRFNGANTSETSEVEADHEEVEEEHIPGPIVPIKKVPHALRRLKDSNASRKLDKGVLQSRNHIKWSMSVPVSITLDAESSIAAVGNIY